MNHTRSIHAAKVLLLGDSGVGKTSLLTRYVTNDFSTAYKTTIGANCLSKAVSISDSQDMSLALWDTAGQERFRSLGAAFYRGSDAVVFVFSILDQRTMEHIASWIAEFKKHCPVEDGEEDNLTWVAIGNKLDEAYTPRPYDSRKPVPKEDAERYLNAVLKGEPIDEDALLTPLASAAPNPFDQGPSLPKTVPFPKQESLDSRRQSLTPTQSIDITSRHRLKSKSSMSKLSRSRSREQSKASIYHTPQGSLSGSTFQPGSLMLNITSPEKQLDRHSALSTTGTFISSQSDISTSESSSPGLLIPDSTSDTSTVHARSSHRSRLTSSHSDQTLHEAFETEELLANGIKVFYASAKSGEGVDRAFLYLARHVHARIRTRSRSSSNSSTFSLSNVRLRGNGDDALKIGDKSTSQEKGWRSPCCR